MELVLKRVYQDMGTNGELLLKGKRICYTIELPWKNNARRVSCIPEGKYQLVKRYTARFGWHLLLVNVPQRDWILLHAANDALKEIKGCIAPVTTLTGPGKGALSRLALQKLMSCLDPFFFRKETVFLTIQS